MDIGKPFSFQFEDNQWISKLGIGAIVSAIPILNFAWSGYMVGILRNVMNGVKNPLPVLLIICLPLGFFAVSGVLSGSNELQDLSEIIAGVGGVAFFGLLCLFTLYGLILSVVYPAILVIFSREGTFASCFKFQEIFGIIGKNPGPFFTAWLISFLGGIGVGLIIGFVSAVVGWIPCIGWIASLVLGLGTTVYVATIYAHLFGQFGALTYGQNQPA